MRKHKRRLYDRLSKIVLVTHGKKVIRIATEQQYIRLFGNPNKPFESFYKLHPGLLA